MAIIWTIVGIIIPFFLGLALSFLGYNPPEFRTARTLIWATSGVLTAWTIVWVLMTLATRETQIYTVIGVGVLNVVGVSASMLFIGSRERLHSGLEGNKAAKAMPKLSPSSLPASGIRNIGVPLHSHAVGTQDLTQVTKQDAENKTYKPFSSGADTLAIDTDDDLAIHIRQLESGTSSGLVLIVDNNRLDAISKVSITVYSAQSFDEYHKVFRDSVGFKATRIIDTGIIQPSSSSSHFGLSARTAIILIC
jgi:hypothetical protein